MLPSMKGKQDVGAGVACGTRAGICNLSQLRKASATSVTATEDLSGAGDNPSSLSSAVIKHEQQGVNAVKALGKTAKVWKVECVPVAELNVTGCSVRRDTGRDGGTIDAEL